MKLNERLMIMAPTAPPNVCGVSDYAWQAAHVLTDYYKEVMLGVSRLPLDGQATSAMAVTKWQDAFSRIRTSSQPYDVFINYTPLSYSWSGWPVKLLHAIKQLKAANKENRVFVFFHETWNGSANLKLHHAIRDRLTKYSMYQIRQMADGVTVVTREQKQKLGYMTDKPEVQLSPIGSNILPADRSAGLTSVRESGKLVIFGLSHTRLWTLKAHLPLLKQLKAKGQLRQLCTVGPANDGYSQSEAALATEHLGAGVLRQLGSLSPAQVSEQLLSVGAALVGQSADSLRKSGSFAALAAHAVPVVCDVPYTLDEPPGSSIFRPSELMNDPSIVFDNEGRQRAAALHNWFWSTRSWGAIGQNLVQWMSNANQVSANSIVKDCLETSANIRLL